MKNLKFLALAALLAVASMVAPAAEAAFSASALVKASPTGVAKAPAVFTYSTADATATIETANYFQSASLRAGDLIFVKGGDGEQLYSVSASTASTSTIAPLSGTWICANGSGYGTAGAVARIAAPHAGKITKLLHTLTTVVDGDVILNLDVGGTDATGSATITAAGVAVGDVDSAAVTAENAVTAGALITVESDGGGTAGAGTACIQIIP